LPITNSLRMWVPVLRTSRVGNKIHLCSIAAQRYLLNDGVCTVYMPLCNLIMVWNGNCGDWLTLSFLQVRYDIAKSTNPRSTSQSSPNWYNRYITSPTGPGNPQTQTGISQSEELTSLLAAVTTLN